MAAYTSTQAGNWSSTATWGGTGPPGSGDTATVGHAVTVDVNTTVGSSPLTGGAAAIAVTDGGLTIAAGVTLTVLGPITQTTPGLSITTQVALAAGASLVIRPPSGQQYTWAFSQQSQLICNGTIGSHCTVATDLSLGGLPTYLVSADGAYRTQGLVTASYADFAHFGDSSHPGLATYLGYPGDTTVPVSIAHCTGTACSYFATTVSTWDGDFTFQDNSFSATPTVTVGGNPAGFEFILVGAATAGARTVDGNSFDATVAGSPVVGLRFTNNVITGYFQAYGASSWPDSTYFSGNLILSDGSQEIAAGGPVKDCYFITGSASNPHYVGWTGLDQSVTGCIAQCTTAADNGDVFFPPGTPASACTFTVTNCIVLPNAAGTSSGKLVSTGQGPGNANMTLVCEHNTGCCDTVEGGLVELGETQNSYAGEVTSLRSNIAWSAGASPSTYLIDDHSVTPATDAITLAGHNATWNPTTGTIVAAGSSTSAAGYTGAHVTAAGFPSSQIGQGDVSGNPAFVDRTRDAGTWYVHKGHATTGTFAGDIAAGVAYAATGPGTLIPDLLAWVRAGFAPTNPAYATAAHDGTTIGAVAYAAPAATSHNSCLLGVGA